MKTKKNPIYARIAGMLKENTGKALLDSGGAYGRNWERNQAVDFDKLSPFSVHAYGPGNLSVTFSVYHYLTHVLRVTKESEKLNRLLKRRLQSSDDYAMTVMEEMAGELNEDEYNDPQVINTYNYDNVLSQTLQYCVFAVDGTRFIALQIHGGCDVRGGYTDPQVFEIVGDEYEYLGLQTDLTAWCDLPNGDTLTWDSDDCGYSFSDINGDEPFEFIVYNDKPYHKSGSRIYFGNAFFSEDQSEGDRLPFIGEITDFVHRNYNRPGVAELAISQFKDEVEGLDVEAIVNQIMSGITRKTAELKF